MLQVRAQASDNQYVQRLASLKSQVELIYSPEVKKHIEAYLAEPEKTKELLGLSKLFLPEIEKNLRQKQAPTDLKYLAVAISGLNPQLQNASGASGIWLMPYNVSKMYKVKVNSYVDERKDNVKSTQALATHFKDLFSIYRQWPLAIAGYAASPIMLNKSIRMAGNSMHIWDVYPHIPAATREAYPKFVAAAYICNFYREHGLKPTQQAVMLETDSVLVNKWLSFSQISSTLEIPIEQLRMLNPVFKKDVIPYNLDGYWVRLPKNKAKSFGLLKDSVYKQLPNPAEFAPVVINKLPTDSQPAIGNVAVSKQDKTTVNQPEPKTTFDKKRVYYTVKRGDNLADVADWFDVTPFEIKSWNKLKSDKLVAKKKLTIWVKQNKTGYYKRINTMSPSQKKKLKKKD